MSPDLVARIDGSAELIAWYGGFPRFHDGYVTEFQLRGDGSGHILLKGRRMTDRVDEHGYFVTEKRFRASLFFEGATRVELSDFLPDGAILYDLEIREDGDDIALVMQSSYGFDGTLRMKTLRVAFEPEKTGEA